MQDIIEQVIAAYGGVQKTQKRFGYGSPMAVYNWRSRGLPRALIADIHVDTKIPVETLMTATKQQKAA